LALYANGELLTQITNSAHSGGKFGVTIGSANTEDLTVRVNEFAYWNLP
jgi:hypothetical protein